MNIKTHLLISILFLLIATCSFSQSEYPKRLVIGNDTTILITPLQLKTANSIFKKYDIQLKQIELKNEIIDLHVQTISEWKQKETAYAQLICEYDANMKKYRELDAINQNLLLNLRNQVKHHKKHKFKVAVGGVLIGASATAITYLVLNQKE